MNASFVGSVVLRRDGARFSSCAMISARLISGGFAGFGGSGIDRRSGSDGGCGRFFKWEHHQRLEWFESPSTRERVFPAMCQHADLRSAKISCPFLHCRKYLTVFSANVNPFRFFRLTDQHILWSVHIFKRLWLRQQVPHDLVFRRGNEPQSKAMVLGGVGSDRKSTRLNSSHLKLSRMPSSA